jgi:hypothetical protein
MKKTETLPIPDLDMITRTLVCPIVKLEAWIGKE